MILKEEKRQYLEFFDLLLQLSSQRLLVLNLAQKLAYFKVLPVEYST